MGKELVDSPSVTGVSHDYSHREIIADPDEAVDIVKEKSINESFNSSSVVCGPAPCDGGTTILIKKRGSWLPL
jgi:hypothetical protein